MDHQHHASTQLEARSLVPAGTTLQMVPALRRALTDAIAEAEQAVNELCRRFRTVSGLIGQSGADPYLRQEIQYELGRALVSMQFHDVLTQRVNHVVRSLERLEAICRSECESLDETESNWDAWSGTSLRPVLVPVNADLEIEAMDLEGNDVELF